MAVLHLGSRDSCVNLTGPGFQFMHIKLFLMLMSPGSMEQNLGLFIPVGEFQAIDLDCM